MSRQIDKQGAQEASYIWNWDQKQRRQDSSWEGGRIDGEQGGLEDGPKTLFESVSHPSVFLKGLSGEDDLKIVSTDVCIFEDQLIVGGKYAFGELLDRARQEDKLVKQASFATELPEEDLTPGHVVPGVIMIGSRSA